MLHVYDVCPAYGILNREKGTPLLVNSQPRVACFLICNRELYVSDRLYFGTIVERIDWYVSSNYYAN